VSLTYTHTHTTSCNGKRNAHTPLIYIYIPVMASAELSWESLFEVGQVLWKACREGLLPRLEPLDLANLRRSARALRASFAFGASGCGDSRSLSQLMQAFVEALASHLAVLEPHPPVASSSPPGPSSSPPCSRTLATRTLTVYTRRSKDSPTDDYDYWCCFPYLTSLLDLPQNTAELVRYLLLVSARPGATLVVDISDAFVSDAVGQSGNANASIRASMQALLTGDACRRLAHSRFTDVELRYDFPGGIPGDLPGDLRPRSFTLSFAAASLVQSLYDPVARDRSVLTLGDLCATLCGSYSAAHSLMCTRRCFLRHFARSELRVRLIQVGAPTSNRCGALKVGHHAEEPQALLLFSVTDDQRRVHESSTGLVVTTERSFTWLSPLADSRSHAHRTHCPDQDKPVAYCRSRHPHAHSHGADHWRRSLSALLGQVAAMERGLRAALSSPRLLLDPRGPPAPPSTLTLECDMRLEFHARGSPCSTLLGEADALKLHELLGKGFRSFHRASSNIQIASSNVRTPLEYLVSKVKAAQDREATPSHDMMRQMPTEDMLCELRALHRRLLDRVGSASDASTSNASAAGNASDADAEADAYADALLGAASSVFLRTLWLAYWALVDYENTRQAVSVLVARARERVDQGRAFLGAVYGLDGGVQVRSQIHVIEGVCALSQSENESTRPRLIRIPQKLAAL
jgi:hypothetical protein